MKGTFVKFLKIVLVCAVAILLVLLIFGLVLALGWPWWVGFFLLLFLVGLGIGILFLRTIWLRRREQQFVQQVIAQDEAHLKSIKGKERDDLKELQDRWKEAVQSLRSSHLRKQGNPLYALPWYLVIGESGTGKTTAINSARLSSPFAEHRRISGISGTRNCDWWFFEQAIILDTAGRYAIPVDEGRDKEEWQKFLTLFVKYRKKEPLNGLIVCVAADKVLGSPPEVLQEDGKMIRRRIDELMRALGVKFPIYLLVTKCDLIQGMTQFCDRLPEKSLDQPMGVMNKDLSADISTFLDGDMKIIGERLRNLRILLLHSVHSTDIDPGLLLFPEEFQNLTKRLEPFMKSVFQENPYQETPILRGLYFSSGRQEGSPYSHFLSALGLIGEREVLPGTSKGLFLHDLFAEILPQDRKLFAPTRRALEWRALTTNLGLISWVLVGFAICGLLSFSFVKNLRTLREISHEFARPTVLKGEFLSDLITMDQFNKAIVRVEDQNRNWWIPRFGLQESIKLERSLKEKFCRQFQQGFLIPFDKKLASTMATNISAAPDQLVGLHVAHLVRRINLLNGRLLNESLNTLRTRPQPPYVSLPSLAEQELTPEERQTFGALYLNYIVWRENFGEVSKEVDILRSWLEHVLAIRGANLQWLVPWVNQGGAQPGVILADFWGGSPNVADEKTIPPGFTRKGKESIDSFVKELESALSDPLIIATGRKTFERWYRTASFDAWRDFSASFPEGAKKLNGEKEWLQMAERMPTDQGAFFSLLNRIATDLEPLSQGEDLPDWLEQIYQFQTIKGWGTGVAFTGKAAEAGKKLLTRLEKTIGKDTGTVSETHLEAGMTFNEYVKALSAIAPLLNSRNQAYQTAVLTYTEDPSSSKSPFFVANAAAAKLGTLMKGRGKDELPSKLVMGPLDFLWTFARKESACTLQKQWEEKVLSETQGVSDQQAIQILLRQDGPVWKFVKGPVEPFLGWKVEGGYYAKEVLAGAIQFDPSFLHFLNKGGEASKSQRQNYSVTIKGLPTDANREARIKPHGTRLELQCAGSSPQSLINLHYPISKTFQWSAEDCSTVLFQIEVSDLVLTKKYEGPQAFPNFLQDFGSGSRTFFPREFPSEKDTLERLGIRYIKVTYQFSGDHGEIKHYGALPRQIPRTIAACWE
jgi:type VI secretion system protein ImpL